MFMTSRYELFIFSKLLLRIRLIEWERRLQSSAFSYEDIMSAKMETEIEGFILCQVPLGARLVRKKIFFLSFLIMHRVADLIPPWVMSWMFWQLIVCFDKGK